MDFQIIGKTMCREIYHVQTHIATFLISLEAFNFFVCNHVQDVFCHSISKESEFCCVKTKVKGKTYIHVI